MWKFSWILMSGMLDEWDIIGLLHVEKKNAPRSEPGGV